MPSLLEKIQADAAKRLPLPAGRHPREELARYKNFLKFEAHRLKILHRGGGSGREVCTGRAAVLDLLIRSLFDAVRQGVPAPPGSAPLPLALVALGGYGRAELNPHSDIDVMLLHNGAMTSTGKATPYMTALSDGLFYTLWDIGLKVGHSVRSVEDCVREANTNMQSKTSLIEARLITGDEALCKRMEAAVLARCVRGFEDEYIAARLEDQETRRTKHGNSATMQEPNIKNGCGGLRDYQNLVWMAFFKYRVRTLADLEPRDLVNPAERKQLTAAYDFLLRARSELHYQVNRPVDVISKSLQPAIAHQLGYTSRSPRRRLEAFMGDLYTHMRNVFLITRTVEQRLALVPGPKRMPTWRGLLRSGRRRATQQLVDGFKIVDGEIHATSNRVLRDAPRRLMRVFLHAQQRGLKLHPDLAQLIRQQLSLVDRAFLKDAHARETFLEILNQRGNVAPVLRAMHDTGFLGKYLPEFGKMTCLVQHEFYHQYTADEHTLICLEKLDQIWGAGKPPFSSYAELFHGVERPFVLYLALLLHDAGKAVEGGDHAAVGSRLAGTVARRLGLDGATTHSLRLVIEHHLAMVQISQRRDLDDPAVIRAFAAQVQTAENLALLTLHTFADTLGTSDKLWNGFKDTLLWTLFSRTMKLLQGGEDFLRAEAKHRELLAGEVRGMLPGTFSGEEIMAHFEHLPERYFQVHSAREIARHLALTHRFMHLQLAESDCALEPVIDWHNEPDRGYTAVTVCTWDRAGLFTKFAGTLTAAGLNILTAQIFTRTDGIVLDTFFATDAKSGLLANREEREKFEKYLSAALTGQLDPGPLIAKLKPGAPAYKSYEGERIPTVIKFDNASSDYYSLLEIETEDRVGLLYAVSHALAELRLDIALAKICTEKGAAIDSFYVTQDGQKILSQDHQFFIADALRTALSALEAN